jgi:chaperonin GroES
MSLEPAGHRVLVIPDPVEQVSAGGIILTTETKDRNAQQQVFGTLAAVGVTAWKDYSDGTPWAKVGDRVVYAKYGGNELKDPATDIVYRLLNDEDICAIVRE